MGSDNVKKFLGVIRAPFLLLTFVCIAITAVLVHVETGNLDAVCLAVVLVAALCAHISVNAFNEYLDYRSGLDEQTTKTPFSGGSGVLPMHPEFAPVALWIGIVSLAITILCGAYLIYAAGWWLLPTGLLGILIITSYTQWINKHPVLCLFAPGFAFGPIMVFGSYFALTGTVSCSAFVASLIPFFLVNNLLLLNQFPDAEADKAVGRRHLIITKGPHSSVRIFASFLVFSYVAVILAVFTSVLPAGALLSLLTVFIAVPLVRGIKRHIGDTPKLVPYLGLNVVLVLSTGALLALGMFFWDGAIIYS